MESRLVGFERGDHSRGVAGVECCDLKHITSFDVHFQVGTEMTRGISGGERKRTNIGIELITDPSVIFLDEPTTGLDTHTASKLMKLLKR